MQYLNRHLRKFRLCLSHLVLACQSLSVCNVCFEEPVALITLRT